MLGEAVQAPGRTSSVWHKLYARLRMEEADKCQEDNGLENMRAVSGESSSDVTATRRNGQKRVEEKEEAGLARSTFKERQTMKEMKKERNEEMRRGERGGGPDDG